MKQVDEIDRLAQALRALPEPRRTHAVDAVLRVLAAANEPVVDPPAARPNRFIVDDGGRAPAYWGSLRDDLEL